MTEGDPDDKPEISRPPGRTPAFSDSRFQGPLLIKLLKDSEINAIRRNTLIIRGQGLNINSQAGWGLSKGVGQRCWWGTAGTAG